MSDATQDDLLERARFVVQLFRECDAIQLPHGPTEQVLTGMIDRIAELEAKLAKAVALLGQWRLASAGHVSLRSVIDKHDATLAELTGDTP